MNRTGLLFLLLIFWGLGITPASAQELKIDGQFFTLDDEPFDMWGVRVASVTQKNKYTRSLIKNLDDYKSEGINTLSVYLQGSSGGYSDPFYDGGRKIKKGHLRRLKNIIEACAQRDMVVVVGIFYQRTVRNKSNLKTEAEIREAVRTVTELMKPYNNIIINIANEQNSGYYKDFKAFNFNDPQNIVSLCKEAKETDPNRIVGAGGYHDSSNVVIGKSDHVDVLLFDTFHGDIEDGHHSGWHYNYFKENGVPEKPIVNVELFGGWTKKFLPQGVYSEKGKEIHLKEIEAAKKQPGLFVHLHSNPWFQAADQDMKNRYDLGGMGTDDNPGVRWFFREINAPELIFQSGFEPGSHIISKGNDADIAGIDKSVEEKNDWEADLDNHPAVGNFNLQYQGGEPSQRFAKIIPEPGNPGNHVLHFWLNEPNVGGSKGRIQANIYGGETGLKEFYQSVRIFLPEDFNTVRTYPGKIHWLTIAEFWNNITWSHDVPYGFRITLGLGKPVETESDLYFILDGQDCELFEDNSQKYTTLWSEINQEVKVPIGKWFTLEYYYKEGDAETGRFYMTIQPEGGEEEVIFDLARFTHNSHDPNPDGVTEFNPLKLYTSKNLIDYMKSQDKTLQIYWDDLKLWKNKNP